MLRTNTVFCCHRNEIIARLKEDFGYETRLPLTGPIRLQLMLELRPITWAELAVYATVAKSQHRCIRCRPVF